MTRSAVVVVIVGLLVVAPVTIGVSHQSEARASVGLPQSATPTQDEAVNETADFPPGTSESGVENATRLLDAHKSRLTDETYSVEMTADRVSAVTGENGTFRGFDAGQISLTGVKGSNATRLTIADENVTFEDGNSSQTYWVTDDGVAFKDVEERGVERVHYSFSPAGQQFAEIANRSVAHFADPSFLLRPYLLGLEYEYSGTVTRNGGTLRRFTSVGVNETAVEAHDFREFPASVERIDATLLVDDNGVVRSFEASTSRSRGNETLTSGTTYAIPRLGDVTPEEPAWVTRELPRVDASLTEDRTAIAIDHAGGMTVSTANVLVSTPSTYASADFAGTFEPGDTLYLHVRKSERDRILINRNDPPEVNGSAVRFPSGNISITPWRVLTGDGERNSTTLEIEVRNATSVSVPGTATISPTNSSVPSPARTPS